MADDRIPAGRRHIIKRPRLTRILDESTARVLMLVAPAGYGKTTLAREWLENRRHAWYQGGPASADVAALAVGLADACRTIVPGAGERMRARLRATNSPEQEVEPLAELLAEDLVEWPEDAWLAIDDYQFAMASPASEDFVAILNAASSLRLFIATRDRPTWATARRLLYGEVHELSRASLAMSQDEASEVLAAVGREEASGLLALADGWPAVIGLASVTASESVPDDMPSALYDFFAQELYDGLSEVAQAAFCKLAAAPTPTRALADFLFGHASVEILGLAESTGILNAEGRDFWRMHPLLRRFFVDRLSDHGIDTASLGEQLYEFYVGTAAWDDAYSSLEFCSRPERLSDLVDAAMPSLLREGRLPTLKRWLAWADGQRASSPTCDLASAEIAYREGEVLNAEARAVRLTHVLPLDHELQVRALLLAGKAALMANQAERALSYMEKATQAPGSESEAYEATWGRFVAAARLERQEAHQLASELDAITAGIPDRELRRVVARLVVGCRMSSIRGLEPLFESAAHLVLRADDPLARSSFLVNQALFFALTAQYDRALRSITDAFDDISTSGLGFAQPHALMVKAHVHLGLRQYSQAASLISVTERAADERRDVFIGMNSAALHARLLLLQGVSERAVALLSRPWPAFPERSMHAEYLATRALALACEGNTEAAYVQARESAALSKGIEAAVLNAAACAIAAIAAQSVDRPEQVDSLVASALETGNIDGLLLACRLSPALTAILAASPSHRESLANFVRAADDHQLARQLRGALPARPSTERLTPREQEVYELLALGLTNKEIAAALFISQPTAKRHTLHIREKLGLRSRTEVALHASLGHRPNQAASATGSSSDHAS